MSDNDQKPISTIIQDSVYQSVILDKNKIITSLGFGSCNHTEDPQSYWSQIASDNIDLWIWMGDAVYADTEDMGLMAAEYAMQKSSEEYISFLEKVPVIGTWDDHDYGVNDGNVKYPKKEESKTLFLDFMNVPPDDEVRQHSGIYQSYLVGQGNQKIRFILLDTRSFQDPLVPNPNYVPRYFKSTGDILGEEQWLWLEETLKKNDAALNIIISSIQFIADEQIFEKWGNFPKAKARMENLLIHHQHVPAVFLSGDRHIAEISMKGLSGLDYPLYDITSSGLTHSYTQADEPNRFRISPLVTVQNYGIMRIDWSNDKPAITAYIKSIDGSKIIEEELQLFK